MQKILSIMQQKRCFLVYTFWLIFLFMFRLILFPFRSREKYLVISRTDHLGDMLCSIPMLDAFCRYAKENNLKTALLVAPANEYIACDFLHFDKIIFIEKQRSFRDIKYRLKCFAEIFSMRIKIFINCVDNDVNAFYGAFSFAEKIIAAKSDGPEYPLLALLSKRYSSIFKYEKNHHIFQRNSGLICTVTGEELPMEVQNIKEKTALLPLPETAVDLEKGKYIILFPGASYFLTCYPPQKYAIVLKYILKDFPEYKIVIAGSEEDIAREKIIAETLAGMEERLLLLCGKTTLKKLFPLTTFAACVIGNDSGGIHLAEAVEVPSVALVSGATYGYYMPNPCYKYTRFLYHFRECFQCDGVCSKSNAERPCLLSITPEEVFTAVRDILSKKDLADG